MHVWMVGVGTEGSAQRLRVGAELRRIRLVAGMSGEQAGRALDWSQAKVSRMETGRTAFTVRDVAGLLAVYGVADDVRAELLAATAEDVGEGAWIVRAGGFPRRQGSMAALESVTRRIRQYQAMIVPGLLQTREYAVAIARAAGATDPERIADARLERQRLLTAKKAPTYDVVIDGRAVFHRTSSPEVARDQVLHLISLADQPGLSLHVIPVAAKQPVVSAVAFTMYDFRAKESPSVVWIEAPTGDVYFSAPEDVARYDELFSALLGVALGRSRSIEYLRTLAEDVERYATEADRGR